MKCSICTKEIEVQTNGWAGGHNAWPAKSGENDRCCARCNDRVVVPLRLKMIYDKGQTKNAQVAAFEHTLQLEWRGDSRLNIETYHVYNWPKTINGSEYDRTLLIEEFADGSTRVYLDANKLGFRDQLLQLRKMANPE
jgi:hypothetical protein